MKKEKRKENKTGGGEIPEVATDNFFDSEYLGQK